jgi:hypothetical protein
VKLRLGLVALRWARASLVLLWLCAACHRAPAVAPEPPKPLDLHAAWQAVLKQYVNHGAVDFVGLDAFPTDLRAYLKRLEALDEAQYRTLSLDEQIALWINAHNAYAIELVLQYWPVDSIVNATPIVKRGPGGAFGLEFIPLGALLGHSGRILSLDDIAREVLQAGFAEPRAYFALARLCKSCPALADEPYHGDTLGLQLEEAGRRFFGDPRKNRFDSSRRELVASSMLQWYSADFAALGGPLGLFEKYGPAADAEMLRSLDRPPIVRYPAFDWSLDAK